MRAPRLLLLLSLLPASAAAAVEAVVRAAPAEALLQRGGAPQRGGEQRGAEGAKKPARGEAPPQRGREREADLSVADRYFATCDHDGNAWISFREASDSMAADRRRFQAIDADGDGRIVLDEYRAFYRRVYEKQGAFKPPVGPDGVPAEAPEGEAEDVSGASEPAVERRRAGSLLELFGTPEPRTDEPYAALLPARIVGPLPTFRRLDHDRDGRVSSADLSELMRPLQLRVRPNAVIASLDRDGDGGLDEAEFFAALVEPAAESAAGSARDGRPQPASSER